MITLEEKKAQEKQTVDKALKIMNDEMSKDIEKDPNIPDEMWKYATFNLHRIHNWLCEKTNDNTLMKAIVKWEKQATILGAMNYVTSNFKELAKKLYDSKVTVPGVVKVNQGIGFDIPDEAVFQLVRRYYVFFAPQEKETEVFRPTTTNTGTSNDSDNAMPTADSIIKKAKENSKNQKKEQKKQETEEISLFDFV
ncbi:Cas9 inhibitor AcrIIA9 family protein [Ligilactobacillus equi]|uniref:E3 ubiquitin-protein ligase ubr11 Pb01 n=2 Tax=Ligilactobacillus equi TaxID=137357 RepID=V7HZP9_9LACO|nr:Cas9 inhibitor AcrIIA9 family protein [Ligilactobacillus equi]ETA74496.1 E3 ubiquitin-protein ligase ubr11 Pb01 [Ligilactobacillus equi DPC 6820]KRL78120.1 hypothetical protein FC36_GL001170 [Ligilactobacillus equi DSM 15833 = JCM 10991]